MNTYFLAIDIGASSGRHILGSLQNGEMVIEEIYRFKNGMHYSEEQQALCWDTDRLLKEILAGLKKCKEQNKIPVSVGIDTWGVDFVLLDENDEMIGAAVGYRDHRTDGMDEKVFQILPEEELYARTGIQRELFNTIYQLMALKEQHPEQLEKAKTLLTMPDYLHYLLSGVKVQEYAEATTTQLMNPYTRNWDYELIEKLGLPLHLFKEISMPGTVVGPLRGDIANEVGFSCNVVLPPSHDTASAIMATPAQENICYISSGTWSLMGTLLDVPDCSPESMKCSFTNEGGYNGMITYHVNIMGLWMIQSVRNALAPDMSYGTLSELASRETISSIVDCQDDAFLSPEDMAKEMQEYCRRTGQQIPETLAEIACVIYNSLAKCYADTFAKLKERTGKQYEKIFVIGGGSRAGYLNRLTEEKCGVPVEIGSAEATAIGNLIAQMIAAGAIKDLNEAKNLVIKEG